MWTCNSFVKFVKSSPVEYNCSYLKMPIQKYIVIEALAACDKSTTLLLCEQYEETLQRNILQGI